MGATQETQPNALPLAQVKLDRLILGCWDATCVPEVPRGYDRLADFRPHRLEGIVNYGRVTKLRSTSNETELTIAYRPSVPWVAPYRVTLIGDDRTGLLPQEIVAVTSRYHRHLLSLVELALDFPPELGVDRDFVLCHTRFGKSRRREDRGGPNCLRFGGRSCPKLVRAYFKPEVGCFRVELELHRDFLKKNDGVQVAGLRTLAAKLIPNHLYFVRFHWQKLEAHLARKFGSVGHRVCEETRIRARQSLQGATAFLRVSGIPNPHRFLKPLRINRDVRAALRFWADRFSPGLCDDKGG